MWLEYYSEDFIDPPAFTNLNDLNRFALKHFNASSPDLLQLIKSKFELTNNNGYGNISISASSKPLPFPPQAPPSKPKSTHKRSCSNMTPPLPIPDSTGNVIYMTGGSNGCNGSGLAMSSSLSKSQINLAASASTANASSFINNKPPSPILFNLFKKSNSNANLIGSNNNSKDLIEANSFFKYYC